MELQETEGEKKDFKKAFLGSLMSLFYKKTSLDQNLKASIGSAMLNKEQKHRSYSPPVHKPSFA
jgi:hypothetical protein